MLLCTMLNNAYPVIISILFLEDSYLEDSKNGPILNAAIYFLSRIEFFCGNSKRFFIDL